MFVFIAGGGRTGAQLAADLIAQNYQVRLLEHRRELLSRLHHELPTEVIYEGQATDPTILKDAGLDKAEDGFEVGCAVSLLIDLDGGGVLADGFDGEGVAVVAGDEFGE